MTAANLTQPRSPKRALVLSGGGARGAYEAGVLRYVLEDLSRVLGRAPDLSILCGSSVGAIHTCFVAATRHRHAGAGSRLARVWSNLDLERVASLRMLELLRTPLRAAGLLDALPRQRGDEPLPDRLHGLFDTRPLERIVLREIRLLLGSLGVRGERFESDLLSYMLFDEVYTAPLVELGYQDARKHEAEIVEFFSD